MAENLMSFISDGPYLHSDARHFRRDMKNRISKQDLDAVAKSVDEGAKRLEKVKGYLETTAKSFLVDWNGDYKKASRDLFRGTNKTDDAGKLKRTYIGVINDLINSYAFVSLIQAHTKKDVLITKEIDRVLEKYSLDNIKTVINKEGFDFGSYVDSLMSQIIDKKNNSKRTYLKNNIGIQDAIAEILNKTKQSYFKNEQSLRKQLMEAVKKSSIIVDWNGIYNDLRVAFLREFPRDEGAVQFIEKIKDGFISKGKKLKASDYPNITGFIAENIEVVIQEENSISLSIFDTGESNDTELIKYANEIAKKLGIKQNQLSIMSGQEGSAKQSGTDWIITNKQGKMIRAQVKNSVMIAEELRQEGHTGRPQIIKLQDTIAYSTLRDNMSKQSNGQGALSDEDWKFLDYLVVNYLWIRSGKAKTRDGSTQVSDIKLLIDQLLSKEIGYFLGVGFAAEASEQAIEEVIGKSNIFFVIDNSLLYPTYLIVEQIILQLYQIENTLMKFHATLGTNFDSVSVKELDKMKTAEKDPDWEWGQEYGRGVLKVGRAEGENILATAQITRANLAINIDELFNQVYDVIRYS